MPGDGDDSPIRSRPLKAIHGARGDPELEHPPSKRLLADLSLTRDGSASRDCAELGSAVQRRWLADTRGAVLPSVRSGNGGFTTSGPGLRHTVSVSASPQASLQQGLCAAASHRCELNGSDLSGSGRQHWRFHKLD